MPVKVVSAHSTILLETTMIFSAFLLLGPKRTVSLWVVCDKSFFHCRITA